MRKYGRPELQGSYSIDVDKINFTTAQEQWEKQTPLDDASPPWMKELYRRFEEAKKNGTTIVYSRQLMESILIMGGTDHPDPTLRSVDIPQRT